MATARDGRDGLARASSEPWDLLIVDRMLPGLEGTKLVRMLRAGDIDTPVLFLTTMGGVGDRIAGLNAGGDDYLVKPFAFAELVARVNAIGRRRLKAPVATSLRVGDIEIDLISGMVLHGGEAISLQPREFRLLAYFMRHAGEVVTRTMLLESVWDFHFEPRTNIVESHISRLRQKLQRPGHKNPIQTLRGAGYMLHATP